MSAIDVIFVIKEGSMKLILAVVFAFALLGSAAGWSAEGLVTLKSLHGVKETMDRLETAVKGKAMTIFARIDHAAGAAKVGKKLRPTTLLIFGNPQGGTPFMECSQSVGIDLPLKVLVWQDAGGEVWLGYNDPAYVAQRHSVPDCPVVKNIAKALAGFAQQAVAK